LIFIISLSRQFAESSRSSRLKQNFSFELRKASASRLAEALPTFEKEQGDDYSLKNRQ
jgi:hypothetical protein